jgi:hypothetical protein
MRPFFSALLALGFAAFAAAADEKKELAREVVLKDVRLALKDVKPGLPVSILSKEDLAKVVEDKDTQGALAKEIDFDKEFALIFAWSGSGGDRLVANLEKETVVFSIVRGRTKDLRGHARVYALAKGTKWEMAK